MSKTSEPRVVAELGRPETPEETAERKAEDSRKYRMRKTLSNLVYSLLVTLGLVLVIVMIVPRNDTPRHRDVDYTALAQNAQSDHEQRLAAPSLPEGWRSNYAEIRTSTADGVSSWQIGFLTPSDEYIGLAQGLDANPSWVAQQLANTAADTTVTIDGVTWTVYDNRDSTDDVGNAEYGMVADGGGSTFVLVGTAPDDEFAELASSLTPTITEASER
ncbi:DUF4245 domain-containing protein [Mycetocola reblochoni]|uniref:Secreted protein n=2 Tax=Mycetocola reblochoni TaxID=331618 RepID=A0A1R4IAU8_9MICO|nr:DUF4245 domain-containing protein [Mycetocola reblochoni]RLP67597.1 DUF4245 domain-containing protein [Mycetocola reblochoni]SJN16928.1 hypothetical protein FM119_00725 [Mycetocola reblochoni REB411]